jgi:hypothetical protein
VSVVIAWLASLVWGPLWLFVLTVLAGGSLKGRVGVLLMRGQSDAQVDADLRIQFPEGIPSRLPKDKAAEIIRVSDRRLRRELKNPELARKVVAAKRFELWLRWYSPAFAIKRLLLALAGLIAWASLAGALFLTAKVPIEKLQVTDMAGVLLGSVAGVVWDNLRRTT